MHAYNPCMLNAWNSLVAPALQDRLTLLLNHVISREPIAQERLRAHVGRTVLVTLANWPKLLPAAPSLAFQITPAALLERLDELAPTQAALRVQVDASNPAALALNLLSGKPADVEIQGDANLATDINWLVQNLRWDIEDDLAAVMGPMPAHQLGKLGRLVAQGMAKALSSVSGFGERGSK